jgi:hypothetical protein
MGGGGGGLAVSQGISLHRHSYSQIRRGPVVQLEKLEN